jgi:hypothetical protein
MTRYHGKEKVRPGIYFNLRQLSFSSMEDEGRLPGTPEDVYRSVPAIALLIVGPLVGLAYVIFLPLIGFVMLARIVLGKLLTLSAEAIVALGRVLQPAWQPARAFLSRGRSKRGKARKAKERRARRDRWAEEVAEELAEELDEESDQTPDDEG